MQQQHHLSKFIASERPIALEIKTTDEARLIQVLIANNFCDNIIGIFKINVKKVLTSLNQLSFVTGANDNQVYSMKAQNKKAGKYVVFD